MATHSSILVWRIPWREEAGGLHIHGFAELDTAEHTHEHRRGTHTWASEPMSSLPSASFIRTNSRKVLLTCMLSPE